MSSNITAVRAGKVRWHYSYLLLSSYSCSAVLLGSELNSLLDPGVLAGVNWTGSLTSEVVEVVGSSSLRALYRVKPILL